MLILEVTIGNSASGNIVGSIDIETGTGCPLIWKNNLLQKYLKIFFIKRNNLIF